MELKTSAITFLTAAFFATTAFAAPIICPSASEIKTAQFHFVFPNMKMAVFTLNAQSGYKGVVTVYDVTTEMAAEATLETALAPYKPQKFFEGEYCMYRPGPDVHFPIKSVEKGMISWQSIM